ncbi:hypothetical protein V6N11_010677 [Hibiscus sabdariffa]|uniref:Uncharacterized protein n=1 Tax=Hibiscus sabdariffa TaxID=183260 RepID=A0ABR2S6F2_9ROSI
MYKEQRLMSRRKRRHSPFRVTATCVRYLDDALFVTGNQLVHVDPRAGVLSYRLDNATRLTDYTPRFHIVAENAVASGDHEGRVLSSSSTTTAAAATTTAFIRRSAVVASVIIVVGIVATVAVTIRVANLRSQALFVSEDRTLSYLLFVSRENLGENAGVEETSNW